VDLPEGRTEAFPVQVELFPAFAHDSAPARFDVRVRESFVGDPTPLRLVTEAAAAPVDTAALWVPARTGASVTIAGLRTLPPAPLWDDWIRVRVVGGRGDWAAVERLIAVHRAP
jgi:hypothetical protein